VDDPRQVLRFVGEGGIGARLRARTAPPLLITWSWLLAGASITGSRRLIHGLERGFGRIAQRLAAIHLDIDGTDHVDPAERYVVVPLHEGLADALVLLRLPLGLRFAARDELFGWPGIGRYLRATQHPLADTTGSVASVRRFHREAGRVFDEGDSLVVFAQGSILGVEVAFQAGALRIARHFGRPLLPVVLTGSHRVWEHPYTATLRFGEQVSMRVLEPIAPSELDASTFRELERKMKSMALESGSARRFVPERDGWWDGYPFEIDPDFADLRDRVAEHRRSKRLAER